LICHKSMNIICQYYHIFFNNLVETIYIYNCVTLYIMLDTMFDHLLCMLHKRQSTYIHLYCPLFLVDFLPLTLSYCIHLWICIVNDISSNHFTFIYTMIVFIIGSRVDCSTIWKWKQTTQIWYISIRTEHYITG